MNHEQKRKIRWGCSMSVIIVATLIFGFITLLRSCLGRYDQFFKEEKAVIVENGDDPIIFTLVQKRNTTAYKRGGGINYTQYNTTIWLQTFDLKTGELIKSKKVMNMRKVKNHPVGVWGAYKGTVWCFINEIRGYDPVTLKQTANIKILEEKNPDLKGKFPDEGRYYKPYLTEGMIKIKAKNGAEYGLDLLTLKCERWDETKFLTPQEMLTATEKRLRENYLEFTDIHKSYFERKITQAEFDKLDKEYMRERDSLQQRVGQLQFSIFDPDHFDWRLSGSADYDLVHITNANDSLDGKWYSIYENEEKELGFSRFKIRLNHDKDVLKKIYTGNFIVKEGKPKWIKADPEGIEPLGTKEYLGGGILIDPNIPSTTAAIHLRKPDGFLVGHLSEIGDDATLLITRVDLKGNAVWEIDTQFPGELQDYVHYKNYLVLFARTNHELTYGSANSMTIINLENGEMKVHDFMKRRKRN